MDVLPLFSNSAVAAPILALSGLEIPALAIGVPLLFAAAYLLVVLEELTHMRKSKPVMLAAGLIWTLIALFPPSDFPGHGDAAAAPLTTDALAATGESEGEEPGREALGPSQASEGAAGTTAAREAVGEAVRHYLLEYGELFLFLLVAMTYVNAMEERKIFDVLRDKLISSGLGYRSLFWVTGFLSFFVSPLLDNMTTALVTFAALAAVGRESPRFVALGCINLVVAANAGGAFSPFGDITTLMVWQDGKLPFFEFFHLFVPALVNFVVPAACMHFAIPAGRPPASSVRTRFRRGAIGVMALFAATVVTAVCMHNFLHLPPVLGMMTGLAYLKLYSYYLTITTPRADASITDRDPEDVAPFDSFRLVARAEWDTLLFFYGVMLCVGGLGYVGYLNLAATTIYEGWGATPANVAIGVLSAVVDNIPVMMAVLEMDPAMSAGQWLLVTLTAGVGGSMLSIGSAAGVALMGQSRGVYTFGRHLAWTPAIALGYVLSILTHFWINHALFLESVAP
ncbi:MAG: sodium:proton antiporter NhaD [Planctomycetaceae bacterium]|nr:sodium:proton antiporter NhaD [Planctomycetaceae bacterium]